MAKKITIALAGNPNSGKTTIFNAITGARQHVGNYPGVTVEKKEGFRKYKDYEINIVDLPGIYSLTAYSLEEIIARNFIIDKHPDVVIDVIDASNIERNLYLAVQLMEMNVPLVLVFNMTDIAQQKGLRFDIEKLSKLLNSPIVQTVGNKSRGIAELLDTVSKMADHGKVAKLYTLHYGKEIEDELTKIEKLLSSEHKLAEKYGTRWLALKLLEQDREILEKGHRPEVLKAAAGSVKHLTEIFGDEPEIIIADRRYGFISGACQEAIENTIETRHSRSDMIDAVLTSKTFGLPIFIGLMYLVFDLVFQLGKWPMGWMEAAFAYIGTIITNILPSGMIQSLLVDGIIAGVGGVITFLPNILLLFAAIAILEDTGYMARAAFVMDRIMHKIGLHGKSFIPMLIGFGCSVPAIMATRILENRRNRIATIFVIPLMSCGARLPIYALIIPAFFSQKLQGPMMLLIYFTGIILAIICAKILRITALKGETTAFVMELPPYRVPTVRSVLIHMWQRGWMYLRKAGTIILGFSIILWAMSSFPNLSDEKLAGMDEQQSRQAKLQNSAIGRIGIALEPLVKPIGFDYKIATALIGAMPAKELFVAQMGIVYSLGEDEGISALRTKLRGDYSPLQGFCVMLFCLISSPCVATVAITKAETGRWKWALAQWGTLTVLAYCLTFLVYQIGTLLSG